MASTDSASAATATPDPPPDADPAASPSNGEASDAQEDESFEVVDGAAAASTSSASATGSEETKSDNAFECNICLDSARDAVISLCGHLFCWPCLHQWLETRPHRQICPVCKAGISRDQVVPLYGRGNTERKDPRDKAPPRPRGQRPEPENTGGGGPGFFSPFNMNQGNGFQMSFGIGAFPFGFFATNFNMGEQRPGAAPVGSAQYEEEQFLHRVFLWVALAFIFWLMVA